MRTIKFRAIKDDMSNCNFVYGNLIYDNEGRPRIQEGTSDLFHTCIKGTEGQFTGLLDKNGTEIYENDNCLCTFVFEPNRSGVVVWSNENWEFSIEDGIDDEKELYYETVEVIGNIHEQKLRR